jgi:hypothetical protein
MLPKENEQIGMAVPATRIRQVNRPIALRQEIVETLRKCILLARLTSNPSLGNALRRWPQSSLA